MKMKLLSIGAMALCGVGALLMSGCADNIGSYTTSAVEPVDKVVYYIAGTVADADGEPVAEVTVVTGNVTTRTDSVGQYRLPVTKTGTHTVLFGLTGYISMSTNVTIPATAGAYSEVPLSAMLYPTALTQVTPSAIDTTFVVASPLGTQAEAGTVPDNDAPAYRTAISLSIPPGATSKQLTISYFAPAEAAINATAGSVSLPMAAINVSPDVASFSGNARAGIAASNPMGTLALADVMLYNSESNASVAADYDSTTNAYAASVSHFSSWLFQLPATLTLAAGDSVATYTLDNSGSEVSLRGQSVTYTVTSGWKLLSVSNTALTEAMTAILTQYKGCTPGITRTSRTGKLNVSAGSVLKMTCTQNYRTETYVFQLADGTRVTTTALQYLDLATEYGYVGHSGGSGE
jgi:hypothetical protein